MLNAKLKCLLLYISVTYCCIFSKEFNIYKIFWFIKKVASISSIFKLNVDVKPAHILDYKYRSQTTPYTFTLINPHFHTSGIGLIYSPFAHGLLTKCETCWVD